VQYAELIAQIYPQKNNSNHEPHEKHEHSLLSVFVLFVTFVVKKCLIAEIMVQCAKHIAPYGFGLSQSKT